MYKGIVLDTIQKSTFLSMAAQEGLICEKECTDGVFDIVTHHTPSHQLARMALEQFIVAGVVYVDPFTYGCMDGELIEKGFIRPYKQQENNLKNFLMFDVDTIQLIMQEKGFNITYYTTDKILEIFDEWKEKAKELLTLQSQHNLNYDQIVMQKFYN